MNKIDVRIRRNLQAVEMFVAAAVEDVGQRDEVLAVRFGVDFHEGISAKVIAIASDLNPVAIENQLTVESRIDSLTKDFNKNTLVCCHRQAKPVNAA